MLTCRDFSFVGMCNFSAKIYNELLMQIFQPWIQKRKLAYAKHKHVMSGFLKYLKMNSLGRLLTDDGKANEAAIQKLVLNNETICFKPLI